MCGRYNEHVAKMAGWSQALQDWPSHALSYNRAPTTQVAAFRDTTGELMRWGMVAPWSKEFGGKFATFNARIETVADKPTFHNAWKKKQRCLVPMAGYYEWIGSKGNKQAMYITDRDTGGLVTAGLYESWGDDGLLSCTILTAPANDELFHIHPRMPIMLTPESAQLWLNGSGLNGSGLSGSGLNNTELNAPADILQLERPNVVYHPVSKAVGNVRNDGAELIEPIDINSV